MSTPHSGGIAEINNTGAFSIGAPDQYIGGHIAIGMVTLLQTVLPVLIYYVWQHDKLEMLTWNPWYVYSWKGMAYG